MIKYPFAVYFKHHWNPTPIWETFWTQTAEQADVQAKRTYIAIGEKVSKVKVIRIVQLELDQVIIAKKMG